MKQSTLILSAAFSILALISCQKEVFINEEPMIQNPIEQVGSVPFVLDATIANTKTTLDPSTWAVEWENGDIIYAVTTDEEWGVAYSSENPGLETIAEFVYDDAKGLFETTSEISDGSHTFNLLYCNSSQKSYHRGASTTHNLSGTQIVDANNPTAGLKDYDAMIAQKTLTTPASITSVTMDHLYTLMKVTLKNKTGESVTVSSFEIQVPDENLAGIFTVDFASPSIAIKSQAKDIILVSVNNGAIANDGQLDLYFVMAPISNYSGEITFKVTDSEDNTYSKTNTVSSLTFVAGTYNTATFTLKSADSMPTIDTSTSNYTTGFETGFTAGSSYNNTSIKEDGPDGAKWGSFYGTVSTNNALTGNQSMQMRWYTSATSNLGYAETEFYLSNVGKVSFSAAATNELKIGLYYRGKGDADWTLAEVFAPTTSKASYHHTFATELSNVRVRFGIVLPSTNPTSNSNIRIDDIVISKAVTLSSIAVSGQTTIFVKGESFAFGGIVTATYSDGSTANVTSNCEYSGYDLSTVGEQTVTVSYSDGGITKTTDYTIEVIEDSGETVLYFEDFGNTGNNTTSTTYNGWSWTGTNHPNGWKVSKPTLTGSNVSSGYLGASGECNLYSGTSGEQAVIHFGDVSSYSNVQLSFGWANNAGNNKQRTMSVEVSGNGGTTWTILTFTTSTNATTNDGFHYFSYNLTDSDKANFSVRFTNTSTNTSRVDDVKLLGSE